MTDKASYLIIIMIKYWVHHNNEIAYLLKILGILLLCYVEVCARAVYIYIQETSMGSVTDPVVGSGPQIPSWEILTGCRTILICLSSPGDSVLETD